MVIPILATAITEGDHYMRFWELSMETDLRRFAVLRKIAVTFAALAACAVLVVAQGRRTRGDELASKGQIDDKAAVQASTEMLIAAPDDKVWRLLSNIDGWPKWQSTISFARTAGPLKPGTEFTWTTGGTKIKSRLALVVPNTDLSWTGSARGAKAIHVWHLKAVEGGGTLVTTKESMSGFLLGMFYSSKDLAKSQKEWLEALKGAAEK